MRKHEFGFTLLEIAIVALVIGILLGVVLKGQELITSARVRSVVTQLDGVKAAYFGFLDRYGAPPGDYSQAANLGITASPCGNAGSGNNNQRIETANGEAILAWEHLSRAGFLSGGYRCSANNVADPASAPANMHNQFLQLVHDNNFTGDNATSRGNIKTGNQIPSYLLAEVDRKIDDGNALEGLFRGSTYTTSAAVEANCWDGATGAWGPVAQNCSAARLF